jgi:hypothetical protein
MAHLDIDSTQRRVYGHAKAGAGFGAAKVGGCTLRLRGLNPLLAAVSTPTCAPVVVNTRLRGGTANSARGAAPFAAESITTARAAGATGLLIARMDSAFYNGATIAACRGAGVRFSVTARMDRKIVQAIAGVGEDAWTPIRYPHAIFDEDEQRWISDAEVAEIDYTAFTGRKRHTVTARLIVRRVRRLSPPAQGELLTPWRHHAVFTDSPLPTLAAETDHRDHAIIEQLIADLVNGPLAHLPSGPLRGHRRLADLRRDRPQPAARRRDPGLPPTRQGPRRHPPPTADQHLGPARAPRTRPADPAPARPVALARRLRGRFRRHPPRTASPRELTPPPPTRTPTGPSDPPPTHRLSPQPDKPQNRQRPTTAAPEQTKRSTIQKMITDHWSVDPG